MLCIYLRQQGQGETCKCCSDKGAAADVNRKLVFRFGKGESGWLIDTVVYAVHAEVAFFMSYISTLCVKSVHPAGWCAVLTVIAGNTRESAEKRDPGKECQ